MYVRPYCVHTHTDTPLPRLYPWWGLVCPSSQLISVHWQRNHPLFPTTSSCTSSNPGHPPAIAKENQWFLYLLTGRADNSMWITVQRQWLTDWDIDLKKSLRNSLQHDLSMHQVKGEVKWEEWEMQTHINLCFTRKVLAAFSRLIAHVPNPLMQALILIIRPGGENYRLHVTCLWALIKIGSLLTAPSGLCLPAMGGCKISSSLINLLTFPRYRTHTSPTESLVNKHRA